MRTSCVSANHPFTDSKTHGAFDIKWAITEQIIIRDKRMLNAVIKTSVFSFSLLIINYIK